MKDDRKTWQVVARYPSSTKGSFYEERTEFAEKTTNRAMLAAIGRGIVNKLHEKRLKRNSKAQKTAAPTI